jgi:hypothetical protein
VQPPQDLRGYVGDLLKAGRGAASRADGLGCLTATRPTVGLRDDDECALTRCCSTAQLRLSPCGYFNK